MYFNQFQWKHKTENKKKNTDFEMKQNHLQAQALSTAKMKNYRLTLKNEIKKYEKRNDKNSSCF